MRVLVTGAAGQLGRELCRVADEAGDDLIAADRSQLDVADRAQVLAAVTGARPDVVVHAAAWTAVDACEGDPDRAYAVNALACRHVAEAARAVGAHVVAVSTDYVFDGTKVGPYVEWDAPNPQSVYGRSKLGGELEADPTATMVRTSWVFGAHGANMVKTVLRLLDEPGELRFVDDQHGCPTSAADLAVVLHRLATERRPGTFHVTNQGPTTWFRFARDVAVAAGHDPLRVLPIATEALKRPAPRPMNSVLDNAVLRLSGIPLLPDHREPLARLVKELTA